MKKYIILNLVFSLALISADWDTVGSIASDVYGIRGTNEEIMANTANIKNSNNAMNGKLDNVVSALNQLNGRIQAMDEGYEITYNNEGVPSISYPPSNYNGFFTWKNWTDQTIYYDNYIYHRRFGNLENDHQFASITGESFFNGDTNYKMLDSVANKLQNDQSVGVTYMETQTTNVTDTKQIINRVNTIVNGYLNASYEDYTFFTLDLRGLDYILNSQNYREDVVDPMPNRFEHWVWKINLVPDEDHNPYVYKIWQAYQKFYVDWKGSLIIVLSFYAYFALLMWEKVLSVFQMD